MALSVLIRPIDPDQDALEKAQENEPELPMEITVS
jgi:hypothetical protein